jgi:streptogramin lyase
MSRATLPSVLGIGVLLASAPALRAQEAGGEILRLDPGFDTIAPADARVEKVAGGFQFTEGPLWRPEGRLWFSDVVGNVVRAVSPAGEVEILIRDAAGESTAPEGSYIGPNGMTAAPDGDVLLAQHWNRRIVRVAPDLSTSVYLDRFEGKPSPAISSTRRATAPTSTSRILMEGAGRSTSPGRSTLPSRSVLTGNSWRATCSTPRPRSWFRAVGLLHRPTRRRFSSRRLSRGS